MCVLCPSVQQSGCPYLRFTPLGMQAPLLQKFVVVRTGVVVVGTGVEVVEDVVVFVVAAHPAEHAHPSPVTLWKPSKPVNGSIPWLTSTDHVSLLQ